MIFPPSIVKPEPGPPKYNPTNAMARRLFQMRKTEGMSEYQAVSSPRLRSGCVVRILGSNHTHCPEWKRVIINHEQYRSSYKEIEH